MLMTKKDLCPCGSQKTFEQCCNRYISGRQLPTTPEALMRSRYSAYTKANIAYIQKTMRGPASRRYNADKAREWAKSVYWLGLKVIRASENNTIGYVEFVARYRFNQVEYQLHEYSEFHYIDNCWYYVKGLTKN